MGGSRWIFVTLTEVQEEPELLDVGEGEKIVGEAVLTPGYKS